MKRITLEIDIITPCFAGGADPDEHAEIRASAVRGQLRWWFRVLGGFKSLSPLTLKEQENLIFGSAAGDEANSGLLIVRTHPNKNVHSQKMDGQDLGHRNFSSSAYLTFPIQSRERQGRKTEFAGKGVITDGSFQLQLIWRDSAKAKLNDELLSLITVFSNLGSLGFRGRRAMGALSPARPSQISLGDALKRFTCPEAITLKSLPATSASNAISTLGAWLKSCRSHGRSGQNEREQSSKYFNYAKNDHDLGYGLVDEPAYRPTLGLPIIQLTQGGERKWNWNWNKKENKAIGRFASPVLLRPYLDDSGWRALVIFIESQQWPSDKKVFLGSEPRRVSLDLYEAMKSDNELEEFIS